MRRPSDFFRVRVDTLKDMVNFSDEKKEGNNRPFLQRTGDTGRIFGLDAALALAIVLGLALLAKALALRRKRPRPAEPRRPAMQISVLTDYGWEAQMMRGHWACY